MSLSRSIHVGPTASMSAAARDAQWISRRTVWAGHVRRCVQYSSRPLPCSVERLPHDGHSAGGSISRSSPVRFDASSTPGDERDHVAGAAHEHGVADAHVARADHLLVGERRAASRSCRRRTPARAPRPARPCRSCRRPRRRRRRTVVFSSAGELERERAARAVRARAGRRVGVRGRRAAARRRRGRSRARRGSSRSPAIAATASSAVSAVGHVGGVEAELVERRLEVGVAPASM